MQHLPTAAALTLALIGSVAPGQAPASASADAPATATASAGERARIVGGTVVTSMDDQQGAAHLSNDARQMLCSAVRVAPRWVLTDRHCVDPNTYTIKPTTVVMNTLTYGQGPSAGIVRTVFAPGGDTALVELDAAPPGPIATWGSYPVPMKDTVVVYGWGRTGLNHDVSPQLKKANGVTVSFTLNGFYAGGRDVLVRGDGGSCYFGDSGGPLFHRGVLIGNVSGGQQDGKDVNSWAQYAVFHTIAGWIVATTGTTPVDKAPA